MTRTFSVLFAAASLVMAQTELDKLCAIFDEEHREFPQESPEGAVSTYGHQAGRVVVTQGASRATFAIRRERDAQNPLARITQVPPELMKGSRG